MRGTRQKTVVDEEVFFDTQPGVAPFQVAGAVTRDTVAQRQVLGTGRRAYRVGLYEAEFAYRLRQCGGFEQAARHGIAAQVVQRRGSHSCALAPRPLSGRVDLASMSAARSSRPWSKVSATTACCVPGFSISRSCCKARQA